MTHADQIIRAIQSLVYGDEGRVFTRKEVRDEIGLTQQVWVASYSPMLQAMRIDHPGRAPAIAERYKGTLQRVSHGHFILTDKGKMVVRGLGAGLLDSPEVRQLKQELDTLQQPTVPPTPETIREVQRILKAYERPACITRYVKRVRGTTCQVCGFPGFKKRNGEMYCEVHHLFHLSSKPPAACLAPEYLIVVCATCHRRMHYADVSDPIRETGVWRVRIDNEKYTFQTER